MHNKYTGKPEAFSSIREITENVRAVINSKEEKLSDTEVLALIEDVVLHGGMTEYYPFRVKEDVVKSVFHSTRKELDILEPYAMDQNVSEIMVNGTEGIFIERFGRIEKLEQSFASREELAEIIRRLAGKVHKEINDLHPIVDARLEDGSRIHAVYHNVALNGPILSIRRFPRQRIAMEELIACGTISEEGAVFLERLVRAGYNIFISGGTSSGKTTFLNVLSNFIPKDERIVVIEDSAELQLTGVENLVRLECREANVQGKGEINVRQLIKASLRMRPDRIIVGEVRGEEVLDMIQAMNTGHDGSLSTGHGNSPEAMLYRLEAMFLMAKDYPMESIRSQIAEAIDIIVHLSRMPDKTRKVLEIVEVAGYRDNKIQLNPLYSYKVGEGLIPTGNSLINQIKLERKEVTPVASL